ncbi:YaaL family protein [Texcoconibacillus texcoconensis]|uniref:DUF2508 family protein n=1 Tax=Texcoconibacillus texcoconensis TaxID=1095777 RepID=A0A840QTT6_9BACI|nr:YaaL family protein [Texcoconibacillus texcoconensis]MBB5174932.1 hypothetical protein [Texcoconibacillus texcoconensis]
MFRKRSIRKREDEQLLDFIDMYKQQVDQASILLENSLDASDEWIYRKKLTEAKYLFLLKEARLRGTSVQQRKRSSK